MLLKEGVDTENWCLDMISLQQQYIIWFDLIYVFNL